MYFLLSVDMVCCLLDVFIRCSLPSFVAAVSAVISSTHARDSAKVLEVALSVIACASKLISYYASPESEATQTQLSEEGACVGACQIIDGNMCGDVSLIIVVFWIYS